MKHQLRSAVCTEGRRMAGARALWVATGMKREQFGKPIIAVVNSFTQFVPGHTHLHEIGQIVKQEIEAISIPGVTLSQLDMHIMASALWAFTIYSTESAMMSREGSE